MARDFYPMVEEIAGDAGDMSRGRDEAGDNGTKEGHPVTHPARIAVYDDAAAAPRVVVVEPKDVRSYLEEITATVNRLSHEQGGAIPFMVTREIVENFIHAYFQAPTITILDGGNTIRFSDQGPGIREKDVALEFGTSSATEEMRKYIRGVGSGLPYAQQYMEDKGGSLTIEDNIQGGTVVTISIHPEQEAAGIARSQQAPAAETAQTGWAQRQPAYQQPTYAQPVYQQPMYQAQPYQQPIYAQQPVYQQQPAWGQPQQPSYVAPQPQPAAQAQQAPQGPQLSERGSMVLGYLLEHDSCGPTDLVRAFGLSGPTWSRELASLVAEGLVMKTGQKHRLTAYGRQFA